jgi:hypothetical protein
MGIVNATKTLTIDMTLLLKNAFLEVFYNNCQVQINLRVTSTGRHRFQNFQKLFLEIVCVLDKFKS